MSFAYKGWAIPEGKVKQVTDEAGNVLWKAAPSGVTVTIKGNGGNYANVVIDGVAYNTATELVVPVGTVITCVTQNSSYGGEVYLNYENVASGANSQYEYTVVSDAKITLGTKDPSGYGYVWYGTISIIDENVPDMPMVSISHLASQGASNQAYVTINGTKYTATTSLLVPKGTVITCSAVRCAAPYNMGGTIKLNGEVVAEGTGAGTITYEYTVVDGVIISMKSNRMSVSGTSFVNYGTIEITEL